MVVDHPKRVARRAAKPADQQSACLTAVLVMLAAIGCGKTDPEPQVEPAMNSQSVETASDEENPVDTDSQAEKATTSDPELTKTNESETLDRAGAIAAADQFTSEGNFAAAANELTRLLLAQPGDVEVLFRLANVTAAAGNLGEAIELLGEIPEDHPQAGLPALGQSADWCLQIERYDDAATRYEKALELAPQAAPALRQLAYVRNRQGRRHEAAVQIRKLCELGNIRKDELHALITLGDAMYDDPKDAASLKSGQQPYWPIGAMGEARKLFSDQRYDEALRRLEPLIASGSASQAARALFGLAAAESQADRKFAGWITQTDENTAQYSEYWAALGAYLINRQKFPQAIRALCEAVERDPTDFRSIARLRQAFLALGEKDVAEQFVARWKTIREVLRINNRIAATDAPDPAEIAELSELLQTLDRPLEAVLWKAVELHYRGAPNSERIALEEKRKSVVASGRMFPDASRRLCGLDKSRFPLPRVDQMRSSAAPRETEVDNPSNPSPAEFRNVATEFGLDHTYRVASAPLERGFAVYQMLGGAVVAFDMDLDGACDLYVAQGGSDPPSFTGEMTNQLYRNLSESMSDVTQDSSTDEFQYSIGATAGDWNQDGFPDLVVTNIGTDTLWINNGDGTFSRRSITKQVNKDRVPASVALADLDADGVPDLYQANYVDDERMVLKPPNNDRGQPILPVLPSKYDAASDYVVANDGKGGFEVARVSPDDGDNSTSLGLIVTDFFGQGGLNVFVANDMKPNQFWMRGSGTDFSDLAVLKGCAFSYTGAATASMGVASGDLDGNGSLDLHITNYERENVSLFLGEGDTFQDRNIQYQLATPSNDVLGFGTQSIDYDNDGRRDIAVANGHIEDAAENTTPFRQLPQLFGNGGDRFRLVVPADPSGYWGSTHLGRGMAKLDFDRDGRLDLVITHIEEPTALILNQTQTDHHWLQLRVVGTESERDGVGAIVTANYGGKAATEWAIAGDGYLSHNEDVIAFGIGEAATIDQIEIRWPSGRRQSFQNVGADRRILAIEGCDELFELD